MSRVIVILLSLCLSCTANAAATATPAPADVAPVILVFGDSLSAGYGLRATDSGWVNLLAKRLVTEGYGFRVVNASVSGETTEGGLARLPRALQAHQPRLVILELGANDGLRALPVSAMRHNLEQMILLCRQSKRQLLLLGLRMPPNYGARYTGEFADAYRSLAQQYRIPVVPSFMDRVADRNELMQADGLHPNEQGQPILLDNIWPILKKYLGDHSQQGQAAAAARG
jgi:acyl-CoA thioesterase-1